MSDVAALKEENLRLAQELKKRTFELAVLYEITGSISNTLNYDDFLRFITDSLNKIIDYDLCVSLLIDEDKKPKMTLRVLRPVSNAVIEAARTKAAAALGTLRGEEVILQEAASGAQEEAGGAEQGIMRSSFDVPLFVRGKAVGILSVASARDAAFSDDEIRLFYTLVSQAQGAIERLQSVLAAEKNKMRIMVERMSEGVLLFDERGHPVLLNASAREMLGYPLSRKEPPDFAGFLNDMGLSASFGESGLPFVKEAYINEPHPRIVHVEAVSLHDDEQNPLGTAAVLRDVTREREIDQMKNDFVSLVSHELRTPLVAIREATLNMLKGALGELNQGQKDFLSLTKRNIERLDRLITDLLDIARIEAGRFQLNKQKTDITRIVSEVAGLFQEAAREKGLRLEVSCQPQIPSIEADTDKLTQVISNLVGNALKFTPPGGTLKIVSGFQEGCVRVDVSDTGVGIPAEDMGKVFDKFYQVSRAQQPGFKGTGLGLAICKGIVEKHGGKIWVTSGPDEGATFSFTLPAS
ncbi:MAG: ATP-binding protein [Candidatus Omnitrophica bacterium]|nr:ATP-binding protein [Candidatus Omnitrophota bacterium]